MLISVVVCTLNEEKYIEKCLKCLNKQTAKPEIIVVDGHSTDKTVSIAKKYADKVVLDKKNGNITSARNLGWKKAKGVIVAYCDADCLPPKHWIETIAKNMKNNVCIYGPLVPYDANLEARIGLKVWGDIFLEAIEKVNYPCICASNAAFKRNILKKYPFRLDFLEDFDLGNRLRKVGKVKFCRKMYMLISARRFEKKGFHRTAFKYYLINYIRLKFKKKQKTYW